MIFTAIGSRRKWPCTGSLNSCKPQKNPILGCVCPFKWYAIGVLRLLEEAHGLKYHLATLLTPAAEVLAVSAKTIVVVRQQR